MSVNFYTGNPGSGKSLHMAMISYDYLTVGKNLITNSPIKEEMIKRSNRGGLFKKIFKRKNGVYEYRSNKELSVDYLVRFAIKNHEKGKENQTLLALDECHVLFNSRDWDKSDRSDWILFFTEHRKLGYEIILTTPSIRMIDKQIRECVEYESNHRDLTKFRGGFFIPGKIFIVVTYYKVARAKVNIEFIRYSDFYGNFYDSYRLFGIYDDMLSKEPEGAAGAVTS